MFRMPFLVTVVFAGLVASPMLAAAQNEPSAHPHSIVVKLVNVGGSMPYAFEPSTVRAERGDTLRFVEDAAVMHNVHFKTHPSGAKLGAAAVGPYLTTKGEVYKVVIDNRFTDGTYTFVCDPHEMIGMRGTLVVGTPPAAKEKK